MNLADEMNDCKGRNQAREALKNHCIKLGIHYKNYIMSKEESDIYFSKIPYSPYSGFKMEGRDR